MYGPDHELSNLRHAYRHAQANNPHYTWYVSKPENAHKVHVCVCALFTFLLRNTCTFIHGIILIFFRSMDDYVCTDEDLEILNKFPRQDLKLET